MNQENKTAPNIPTIEIEVQGHRETLCFAEKADPEIAICIRQARKRMSLSGNVPGDRQGSEMKPSPPSRRTEVKAHKESAVEGGPGLLHPNRNRVGMGELKLRGGAGLPHLPV